MNQTHLVKRMAMSAIATFILGFAIGGTMTNQETSLALRLKISAQIGLLMTCGFGFGSVLMPNYSEPATEDRHAPLHLPGEND